jgi:hypothetical protein
MQTMYKMNHPKADIDRLHVKKKEGGIGLVQVEAAYKTQIINIAEYHRIKYKGDQIVNIIKKHERTQQNMNSIVKQAAMITEKLSQLDGKNNAKQVEIQRMKAKWGEVLKWNWKNKAMHQQYIRNVDRQLTSEVVAAQDQALQTKYLLTYSMQQSPS